MCFNYTAVLYATMGVLGELYVLYLIKIIFTFYQIEAHPYIFLFIFSNIVYFVLAMVLRLKKVNIIYK